MIVIGTETIKSKPSASANSLRVVFEAARTQGLKTYAVPDDPNPEVVNEALDFLPEQEVNTLGVFVGFIPTRAYYEALYKALLAKKIKLINNIEEMCRAMEFDRFYPLIKGLTPVSEVAEELWQCQIAAIRVGYPVFVKGAIKSQKEDGWKACVAHDTSELSDITIKLKEKSGLNRGKYIIRKLVELRHNITTPQGFPCGREFRIFLYRANVLGCGYYWPHEDELSALTSEEQGAVYTLAREAARRVDTPLMCVDIGQTTAGDWIVIEVGDAQFCGVSQMSPYQFWNSLEAAVKTRS